MIRSDSIFSPESTEETFPVSRIGDCMSITTQTENNSTASTDPDDPVHYDFTLTVPLWREFAVAANAYGHGFQPFGFYCGSVALFILAAYIPGCSTGTATHGSPSAKPACSSWGYTRSDWHSSPNSGI